MELNIRKEGSYEYIEEGEGPLLLLLHGLFGALSNWQDVLEEFSTKYKVVIPLMPIYTMPMTEIGVRGLAKFVNGFVRYKKYTDFVLLGNSLGGHVALVYAKYYPENVRSMVLTGSSGLYENAMGGSYPKRGDKAYIREKVAVTFYDPKTTTEELVDEVFEITNDRLKVIRILAIAKSAIRHNMADDIMKFKMPVCLIWGRNDIVTPPEVAEEFHQLLEFSDLYWIDKCGHAPMMEKPLEFNKILKTYFEKQRI